jgi:hypothetical protein
MVSTQEANDCPDSLFRIHLRDLPEFFLQTTGNLLVWAGHSAILYLLVWLILMPIVTVFLASGLWVQFPRSTIRRASASKYVHRLPVFLWPAILIGLLTYQYFNWLPYGFYILLFSSGVLALWFLLSTVIFIVPSRAFSLQGSAAMSLFSFLLVLFIVLYPQNDG